MFEYFTNQIFGKVFGNRKTKYRSNLEESENKFSYLQFTVLVFLLITYSEKNNKLKKNNFHKLHIIRQ